MATEAQGVEENTAPPQTRMQGDARRRLIQARAAELFSQNGFARTTMRDIAEASGLQKGSLYHFYPSKELLLLDIYRDALEVPQSRFDEIVALDTTYRDKVEKLITALVEAYEQMMPWMTSFTRGSLQDIENPDDQQMLKALSRRFQDTWDEIIKQGMKSGEFRSDIDNKLASFAILGTINWMYKWYDPAGRVSARKIAQDFSTIILDGLSAR